MERQTESKGRGIFLIVSAIVATIVSLLTIPPVIAWFFPKEPDLQEVSRRRAGHESLIVAENQGERPAIFGTAEFWVTDPRLLRDIERRIPEKIFKAQTPLVDNNIEFHGGTWYDEKFVFTTAVKNLFIPAGDPEQLRISVFFEPLEGMELKGRFRLTYDGDEKVFESEDMILIVQGTVENVFPRNP